LHPVRATPSARDETSENASVFIVGFIVFLPVE
jgi:hypothetical protein